MWEKSTLSSESHDTNNISNNTEIAVILSRFMVLLKTWDLQQGVNSIAPDHISGIVLSATDCARC